MATASKEPWWQTHWVAAWVSAIAGVVGVIVSVVLFISASSPSDDVAESITEIFVYGTMKPGHAFYPEIDDYVLESRPDLVRGQLYDSGLGYPAAIFNPEADEEVSGYVLSLVPESYADAVAIISGVESNLFSPKRVATTSGSMVRAYEFVGDTTELERIPDGVWKVEQEAPLYESPAAASS
jgi:gamma-glutamylcyclotransferase (GGCT)/AIG2-like uncharacterized protein YtfP